MTHEEHREVLLRICDLKQYFPIKHGRVVKANDGISLDIYKGETLGLVGESGCGKSTLGRTILQLYHQTQGSTLYFGRSLEEFAPRYAREVIRNLPRLRDRWIAQRLDEAQAEHTARVVGGFLAAGDLEAVQAIYNRLFGETDPAQRAALHQQRNELRKACADHPDFSKYEAFRTDAIDLTRLQNGEMRRLRRDLQLIFQDPYSSLNPRMSVGQIIGEGLRAHGMDGQLQEQVLQLMEQCGLPSYFLHRFPHQFSGGQRQRIGIARALATHPKFVVCDEAVSALDVSIQAQIINLLQDLKAQEKLTYLFITHDLSVVKYISDRIGVMYLGNLMELAPTDALFAQPLHPYTWALLHAIPTIESDGPEDLQVLEGDMPSPVDPPKGCKFHTRCPHCTEICRQKIPVWETAAPGHFIACHHWRDPL